MTIYSLAETDQQRGILALDSEFVECGGKGGKPEPCPTGRKAQVKKSAVKTAAPPQKKDTAKSIRAKKSHVPASKEMQDASEAVEVEAAKAIGATRSGDNSQSQQHDQGQKLRRGKENHVSEAIRMSYEATIDERSAGQVATNKGWRDFGRWVETLEGADELRHLTEYGWSNDMDTLEDELTTALHEVTPDEEVSATGHGILQILDTREPTEEVIVVGDGAGDEANDEA